jgi:hypothetical protein
MASKYIFKEHVVAAAYVIFFLLDLWITSDMVSIGMVPMAFLFAAVNTFLWIVLRSANRKNVSYPVHFLINWWMVFLAIASIVWLFFYSLVYLSAVFPLLREWPVIDYLDRNTFLIDNVLTKIFCAYSLITAILTISLRSASRSHGWLCFTAWAFFGRFLIPLIWDPMPNLVYRYEGLFGLPVLYGLLMIALSVIHERYQPPDERPAVTAGVP